MKKLLEPYGKVILTLDNPKQLYSEFTKEGRKKNLQYRCDVANKVDGQSVFISIHANAHDDENVSGYEIFVTNKSGDRYKLAQCIMKAAEDILSVGHTIKNRGVKEAGFYVLNHTKMPAILIEHEFYTNDEAVIKLKDNEFRQRCADHIFKGLLNYMRE